MTLSVKWRWTLIAAGLTALLAGIFVNGNTASAATPAEDLAFAQQLKRNCELQLVYATTPEETAAAQACVTIQDKVIAGLTAPTVTPTPTETATPTQTPTADPTTPAPTTPPVTTEPPPLTWPTAANTGYLGAMNALSNQGCVLNTNNAVYDHKLFDCSGANINWLTVNATGVQITNSVIYAGQYGGVQTFGSASFTDVTIMAKGSNPFSRESAFGGHNFSLLRVRSYSGGDGVDVEGDNISVMDSFFEQHPTSGAHSDGVQLFGTGANVVIRHNTFTQRGTPSTSPIFWSGDVGPAPQFLDNLLVGGMYSFRIGGGSGNGAIATGNVIARNEWGAGTGPTSIENPCGRLTWSNNSLADVSADYATVSNYSNLTIPC